MEPLHRFAAADDEAAHAVIERYGALVRSLARRRVRDPSELDDAVQDVFVELWRRAGQFDPAHGTELGFVSLVARHRLVDRLRAGVRRDAWELDDGADDDSVHPRGAEPLEAVEIADSAARVRALLERLPEDERRVLELTLHEGSSRAEIARALGLTLGAVRAHARRGIARLRAQLGVRVDRSSDDLAA